MTDKELIIDCLADDYEDCEHIFHRLVAIDKKIEIREIEQYLKEMLDEGLIYINWSISNESDGMWYGMTDKGWEFWRQLPGQ